MAATGRLKETGLAGLSTAVLYILSKGTQNQSLAVKKEHPQTKPSSWFLRPTSHFLPPDCVCRACGLWRRDPHPGPVLWLSATDRMSWDEVNTGTAWAPGSPFPRERELQSDFPCLPGPIRKVETSSPPGWWVFDQGAPPPRSVGMRG